MKKSHGIFSKKYIFISHLPNEHDGGIESHGARSKSQHSGQFLPPYFGSGLTHDLYRALVASFLLEHVFVQPDQLPHVLQPESMNKKRAF